MAKTPEEIEAERKAQEAADEAKRKADEEEAKRKADAAAAASVADKGGFKVTLTDVQRKALLEGKPLELSDEQYTGGVRDQVEKERRSRRAAEKQLADIAKQREEEEKKALVEQEKYKELYEKEAAGHKTTQDARNADAIRSAFLVAAVRAGVVDVDLAFLAAKASPLFAKISLDDNGAVTGVNEVLEDLVKQKPFLVSQQRQTVGGPSNPNTGELPAPKTLAEAGDQLESRMKTGQV
jgi:vancomycin resistance protein YoaR